MHFKSKTNSLNQLSQANTKFNIPKFISFGAISFQKDNDSAYERIVEFFQDLNCNLIVRSSASDEDGSQYSGAGEYDSIPNVSLKNKKEVINAVNVVIDSYKKKRPVKSDDEIIVQQMIVDSSVSGVVFTYDMNTGAPYYVINYDDKSGLTDTVTSGVSEYANRTLYIYRNSVEKLRSSRFSILLQAIKELEEITGNEFLDIEFSLSTGMTPYLLQVRTITTKKNWNRVTVNQVDTTLAGVSSFMSEHCKKIDGIIGDTTIFGQMSDWNPVEMIGRTPRVLSASLYQTLITDHAWRNARDVMGYKTPAGHPLMVMLAGQPFIDVRLSFYSYLPKGIPSNIAEKLVNHWIDSLKDSPELHDKIEFEVAITTFSFDIDEKIEKLIGDVLSLNEKEEFKQAHIEHTIKLIKDKTGEYSINDALKKIEILGDKQREKSTLFSMVDDCISFGTTPFAILARHGFIAKTILLSLVQQNIITQKDVDSFFKSVHTVASELVEDINSIQNSKSSSCDFMEKFGHLRPGTYDINSHRYDQMSSISNGPVLHQADKNIESFVFSQTQQGKINRLLAEYGFNDFNAKDLLSYMQKATAAREYGKFVFTRSVSDMLELIAKFSEKNGLSRDEISHVPLNDILNIEKYSGEKSVESRLRNISRKWLERNNISVAIRLPQLLIDSDSVYIIPFQVSHPNFITHKSVTSSTVKLCSDIDEISLNGKIVVIEGADPGFDWIFSQKIAGLITKYGGVNSHMAIRCAEFSIPAAIGCGEQRFNLLASAKRIHLDCAAGLVNPIH